MKPCQILEELGGREAAVRDDPQGEFIVSSYDLLGRVSGETHWAVGGANISRTYDPLGQEKQTSYPDAVVVQRTYDSQGFLDEIKTDEGDVFATAVAWDALGRLSSWTAGNDVVSTIAIDDDTGTNTNTGRLKQITINHPTLGNLEDLVYGFDDGDRVTSITDLGQGLANRSFGYDGLNRLTSATGPYASGLQTTTLLYSYDTIGNLLCKGATSLSTCQAKGGTEFGFTAATRPHAPTSINGQTPEYLMALGCYGWSLVR